MRQVITEREKEKTKHRNWHGQSSGEVRQRKTYIA